MNECTGRDRIGETVGAVVERPSWLPDFVQDPVVVGAFGTAVAFGTRITDCAERLTSWVREDRVKRS